MKEFIKESNIFENDVLVCCKVDEHFSIKQLLKTIDKTAKK